MGIYEASVSLIVRALVVSARWAACSRRLGLERACAQAEAGRVAKLEARIVLLEDAIAFRDARLEVLEKRLGEERPRRPYPVLSTNSSGHQNAVVSRNSSGPQNAPAAPGVVFSALLQIPVW